MNEKVPPGEPDDVEKTQRGYMGVTPPVGQLPAKGRRVWVDRPEQLLAAVMILKQAPVIAVDAEFTQIRSRTQNDPPTAAHRLALLQLAIDGHCFIVDALRLQDLSPLATVTDNPAICILLHGAGADLRVMAERGLNVAHYIDLEATSRAIFGQHESSLAAMLQRAFHTRLDKSLQRTDWTRRPLPPAMVAYAARDAEMTLALYYWLNQHFPWALKLYETSNAHPPEAVAAWIEPFLRGGAPYPPDAVIAQAIQQGAISNQEQVYADCRVALKTLTSPMRRSRLLRLIADLSLVELAPQIEPLLQAPTADERASAIRTLGRLGVEESKLLIPPLLQDPVFEVRQAAQTALRASRPKGSREAWTTPVRNADGTRSWTVGEASQSSEAEAPDKDDWRARLRSIMND